MKSQAQNSFVNRLLDNDPDVLYEMRVAVEGLVEHPGWVYIMELVEARTADTQLLMETGLHHQAEYTAFIAEIRGMRAAKAAADAVIAAAEIAEERNREFVAQMAAKEAIDHG